MRMPIEVERGMVSNVAVVSNCSELCIRSGCQYGTASIMFDKAKRLNDSASLAIKDAKVGMALWCDEGQHAFSEKEDNMAGTRTVTRNGQKEVEDYLICSVCMNQKSARPVPQIANVPSQTDRVHHMPLEDEEF